MDRFHKGVMRLVKRLILVREDGIKLFGFDALRLTDFQLQRE